MELQEGIQLLERLTLVHSGDLLNRKVLMLCFSNEDIVCKWNDESRSRFAELFIGLDNDHQRILLTFLGIKVEPDKIKDSLQRSIALMKGGVSRFDVFAKEIAFVYEFCLLAYNNNLKILNKIDPSGECLQVLDKNRIDDFGCTNNWFEWFLAASDICREKFVKYIIEKASLKSEVRQGLKTMKDGKWVDL